MGNQALVLISGGPGVGKSELAEALTVWIAARRFSRDQVVRDMRGPTASLDRAGSQLWGFRRNHFQDRATRRLEDLAEQALRDHDVVVDVVADPLLRSRLRRLAHGKAAYLPIEVICSDTAELSRRLAARGRRWKRIAKRSASHYERDPEGLLLDTIEPVPSLVDTCMEVLEQKRREHQADAP